MKIELALTSDAEEISTLITELSGPFFISPLRVGAEPFLASVSVQAERQYLSSSNFLFYVAREDTKLAGFVALRDNSHLFHLFVAKQYQGKGLSKKLWNIVKLQAVKTGNQGFFTVNASLNAIPAYQKFGFITKGGVQRTHGIAFQAMQLTENCIA